MLVHYPFARILYLFYFLINYLIFMFIFLSIIYCLLFFSYLFIFYIFLNSDVTPSFPDIRVFFLFYLLIVKKIICQTHTQYISETQFEFIIKPQNDNNKRKQGEKG